MYVSYYMTHFFIASKKKKYFLWKYLMENLIDKIHIVPGGQQNGMHHVVDMFVLFLNAAQTRIAGPSVRQRAAVGVALLRLPRWPICISISRLILLFLLAAAACSHSLDITEKQS